MSGTAPAPATTPPLVLMLSAAHPPADIRIVAKEGAALAAAGWDVVHLCPEPEDGSRAPETSHGVRIKTHPRAHGWLARYLGARSLAKRAEALLPDVVHAHEPDSWLAAVRVARRTGAYAVLDVHEHYPSRLDSRVWQPFRGLARWAIRRVCTRLARRADAIIVAKDGLADAFPKVSDIVPVRNYAAPVAVTPRRHREGPVTLVHLGALGTSRGAMEMLRALQHLPTDVRLLLIGRFTDGSEEEFRKATVTLGVADRVDGYAWMPHGDAVRMAAEADIGLVLFQPGVENHRLALPHKLFDCMIAGIPVIVPAFAEEVAEVVREAGCGVLVDAADPKAIAAAVKALSDPELRQELGDNGRRAALGRFSWNTEAERLIRLYRELAPLPAGVAQDPRPAVPRPAARAEAPSPLPAEARAGAEPARTIAAVPEVALPPAKAPILMEVARGPVPAPTSEAARRPSGATPAPLRVREEQPPVAAPPPPEPEADARAVAPAAQLRRFGSAPDAAPAATPAPVARREAVPPAPVPRTDVPALFAALDAAMPARPAVPGPPPGMPDPAGQTAIPAPPGPPVAPPVAARAASVGPAALGPVVVPTPPASVTPLDAAAPVPARAEARVPAPAAPVLGPSPGPPSGPPSGWPAEAPALPASHPRIVPPGTAPPGGTPSRAEAAVPALFAALDAAMSAGTPAAPADRGQRPADPPRAVPVPPWAASAPKAVPALPSGEAAMAPDTGDRRDEVQVPAAPAPGPAPAAPGPAPASPALPALLAALDAAMPAPAGPPPSRFLLPPSGPAPAPSAVTAAPIALITALDAAMPAAPVATPSDVPAVNGHAPPAGAPAPAPDAPRLLAEANLSSEANLPERIASFLAKPPVEVEETAASGPLKLLNAAARHVPFAPRTPVRDPKDWEMLRAAEGAAKAPAPQAPQAAEPRG